MLKNILIKAITTSALIGATILNANQLDDIKSSGEIKIAVPQDFPPFGSAAKDMSVQGYDVDMGKYIANKLGVKLKIVPVTSVNSIPYLKTGKADLIISSLGKNAKEKKLLIFLVLMHHFS